MLATTTTTPPATPAAPHLPLALLLEATTIELVGAVALLPLDLCLPERQRLAEHAVQVANALRAIGEQNASRGVLQALSEALSRIESRRVAECDRLKARLVALEAHGS